MIGWDNFVLQTSLLNYNLCSLYDHSHLMHCVICWILLSIFLLNVQCPPYDFWKWSSKWEGYHEVVQWWERPRGYVCPVCDWMHQVRWQDQTIIVARHPCDCWHVHHGLSCLFPIYMVTHAFLHFFPSHTKLLWVFTLACRELSMQNIFTSRTTQMLISRRTGSRNH